MEIRSLPADEAAVRRYVEDLWLPYHRSLEATVDAHALADDIDVVAEEVEFRQDQLEAEDYRAWVAIDENFSAEANAVDNENPSGHTNDGVDIADGDGELAGFVTTEIDEPPTVFDRPVRLCVGDIYVREPNRGDGLARALIDRAAERARETDCAELALDVDVDNERATAFYEKLGFEPYRRQLTVPVNEL
jgi:GNAT superfamily N-acetyltransferase